MTHRFGVARFRMQEQLHGSIDILYSQARVTCALVPRHIYCLPVSKFEGMYLFVPLDMSLSLMVASLDATFHIRLRWVCEDDQRLLLL